MLNNESSYWMTTKMLGLSVPHVDEWKLFITGLNHLRLRLSEGAYTLFGKGTKLLAILLLNFPMSLFLQLLWIF